MAYHRDYFSYVSVTLERRLTSDREKRELKSAFSRYVAPTVVESILQDPSRLKLGGEKRRMTVLFSDVRGFTTISESLPPEQLVEIMNTYLTAMTEIVFANGGTLDKYIGDAVMAFGTRLSISRIMRFARLQLRSRCRRNWRI